VVADSKGDVLRERWTLSVGEGKNQTQEDVEITIDLNWLVSQVGRQAIANRGGKSSAMCGAVKARHVRRKQPWR
jgi:hypothetical protein